MRLTGGPRPPPAERGDADRAAIYGIYMLLRSSDTDFEIFVFFAFTGTRVAQRDGTVVSTTASATRRSVRTSLRYAV